jgi:NAD(P)-dependent dehydrogenase (short-subunit alcohol dehydrogenase family)
LQVAAQPAEISPRSIVRVTSAKLASSFGFDSLLARHGDDQMKHAIVTGGAGLIGSEICRKLLAGGWRVASFDVKDGEGDAVQIQCDIGREADVDAAFERLGWDRVDLLVNNGGRASSITLELTHATLKDWNDTLAGYLTGAFLMSRRAAPLMPRGSSIVNMASTRAFMSEGGDFIYATAKGGLVSMTQALAIALGPEIRVNAIAPGWISGASNLRDIDHSQHPVGRVGRPSDIADAVLYLEGASFVTGQVLIVDGGMTRRMIYEE